MLERNPSHVAGGCVFEVYRQLGCGFLEQVCENALLTEPKLQGIPAQTRVPIAVRYKNAVVGEYFAGPGVDGVIMLELKADVKYHQRTRHGY